MKSSQTSTKVSVCVTIFNEIPETVNKLLKSLNSQTLKPNEIIIIDAKDFENCSRSKGRNIAISKARNKIIAITDAGCVPHRDWLAKLTKSFVTKDVDVVAGGYTMVAKNNFERAESVFLGTHTTDIDNNFMPSARSMAFTKKIWKKVGGFPEKLKDTAEDSLFNIELLKANAKFVVAKDAIVDWQMPETLAEFTKKTYRYAKGDADSGIWWHPTKKWKTHNIKVLTIFLRYLGFFAIYSVFDVRILGIALGAYMLYAYNKAKLWGIVLQFTTDFACIIGLTHGLLQTSIKRY